MTDNWRQYLQYTKSALPIMSSHTFYAPALSEDSVVFDLGASTAPFSKAMVYLFKSRCFVAEAMRQNFDQIQETDRIKKFHCAIGGVDGPTSVWLADDEYHWGSVLKPGDFKYEESETVSGWTFKTFQDASKSGPPDLVKLDIEGAEFQMFDAMSDELIENVGQYTVEFHDFMNPDWGPNVHAIQERLSDLGFNIFSFSRRFHGDVLFLNRRVADPSSAKKFYYGNIVKTHRGLRRMAKRYLGKD